MPERHRELRLTAQPPVGDDADKVLRGQRLKDWHEELDGVLVSREFTGNRKVSLWGDK